MTNEEAIKQIKSIPFDRLKAKQCDALEKAIEALENEKQIPRAVIFVHPLQEDDGGDYMCPSCKSGTVYDPYGNKSPYCHYCGQKLRWE